MAGPVASIITLFVLQKAIKPSPGEIASIFVKKILIFLAIKFFLLVSSIILVFCVFDESKAQDDSSEVREESQRKGIWKQLGGLKRDGIFGWFVYGPLLGIAYIFAVNNHLYSILSNFSYKTVRRKKIQKIWIRKNFCRGKQR